MNETSMNDTGTGTHCAYRLTDLDGRVLAERDPHRAFYAASTIKLHVLLAALGWSPEGAEDGTPARPALDLGRTVPATRTFRGVSGGEFTLTGDHLDPTHPADGTPMTVRELLTRMIDRSSNEATDTVITLLGDGDPAVGLEVVTRVIAGLGLGETKVERPIGDDASIARGLTIETSAADLTATMATIVRGDGLNPTAHALALAALRAQRIAVISTVLREGIDAGSKSGEVDGIRHDVAFVGDLVLAVLTSGYEHAAADVAIQALTRELLPDLTA